MWQLAYFLAWILKLVGYSKPYDRFGGVKRRPKESSGEGDGGWGEFAYMGTFLAIAGGLGMAISSIHAGETFEAIVWFGLMLVSTICTALGARASRKEAERVRDDAVNILALERAQKNFEMETLEECRRRRERRDAIRAGETEDDGLSEWGRHRNAQSPSIKKFDEMLKDAGVKLPDEEEDIFMLEARDKAIESAWKKKELADAAWSKALSE